MRIAALIFGILAGLSALPLAQYGHAFVALGGGKDGSLLYLLPLLSFLGAGIAINYPLASGALLALCALILLAIGANFGSAVNFITIGPVLLNGAGALFAFIAGASTPPADETSIASNNVSVPDTAPKTPSSSSWHIAAGAVPPVQFDRAKWNALVKYDEDIGRVAEEVSKLGHKWVDVLAADYLALGDKRHLPQIIRKLIEDSTNEREALAAEREAALQESRRQQAEARRQREEREARRQALRNTKAYTLFWSTTLRKVSVILLPIVSGILVYFYHDSHREIEPNNQFERSVRDTLLRTGLGANPKAYKMRKTSMSGDWALQDFIGPTAGSALLKYERIGAHGWILVDIGRSAWSQQLLVQKGVPLEDAAVLVPN